MEILHSLLTSLLILAKSQPRVSYFLASGLLFWPRVSYFLLSNLRLNSKLELLTKKSVLVKKIKGIGGGRGSNFQYFNILFPYISSFQNGIVELLKIKFRQVMASQSWEVYQIYREIPIYLKKGIFQP